MSVDRDAVQALIEDFDQVVKLAYGGITVEQLGVEEHERLARIYRTMDLLKEAAPDGDH